MTQDFNWVVQSLGRILPEVILLAAMAAIILFDLIPRLNKGVLMIGALLACLAGFGLSVTDFIRNDGAAVLFLGSAVCDRYTIFFRLLFLALAAVTCLFSWPVVKKWATGQGEYYALLLSCVFGMVIMAQANDLLMMYLSLEFVSVTSYVMSGLLQKNRKSAEASLKYIIYGAAASGVMIYGMTYLYGLTGTLNIQEIGRILSGSDPHVPPTMKLITSVLIAGGFAYKIAAVPFHMWCPDVYEGAPTPVTAFFSIGPKIAGFAMFARFLAAVFGLGPAKGEFEWNIIIALLALMTMAVGNFAALGQSNLKRLLAYSGIAHAGYMLLIFLAFTHENIASLLFYASVYFVMNLGAFLIVIVLEEKYGVETVEQCRGLGWKAPGLCAAMTIFLFSLTGVPPFAGFIGKLLIFGYIIRSGQTLQISMAVLGVLFSVVSLYYYAKIVKNMFLEQPDRPLPSPPPSYLLNGLLWLMALGTVVLGIWWEWLYRITQDAARNLMTRL